MDPILIIFLIAVGAYVVSQLLNLIMHVNPADAKARQQRLMVLSKQMQAAQQNALGGSQGNDKAGEMEALRQEFTALMKEIAKKQFLPMGIQCVIFIVGFGILNLFLPNLLTGTDYWIYTGFAFAINIGIWALRRLIQKLRGIEPASASAQPGMGPMAPVSSTLSWKERVTALNDAQPTRPSIGEGAKDVLDDQ